MFAPSEVSVSSTVRNFQAFFTCGGSVDEIVVAVVADYSGNVDRRHHYGAVEEQNGLHDSLPGRERCAIIQSASWLM